MADEPKKEPAQKPTILYIIGANSWDIPHDPDAVRKAFQRHNHDVIILGESADKNDLHGKKDILLKDIGAEVEKLARAGKPFTVYLDTHGGMRNDVHHILLGDQFDREKLYEEIKTSHPEAKQFTLTLKRGDKDYHLYDRAAGIDPTKPMTFEKIQGAVERIRAIGPDTRFTNEESEEKDFQLSPYGGGGIFGGRYQPMKIEIKPEGTDKTYTIPLNRAVPTRELFRTVSEHAQRHEAERAVRGEGTAPSDGTPEYSFFSPPCYGGGASIDLDQNTPKGTVFVSLSDGYQPVYVNDTDALIRAIRGLAEPDFSKLYDARKLINEQGGTLTVTPRGEKEPAFKLSREGTKPDIEKIQKQLEEKGGSWTITDPGADTPSREFKVAKGQDLQEDIWWKNFVRFGFADTGGTLDVKLNGEEKPIRLEYKPIDSKDWEKAEALLREKKGVLEVVGANKETIKVENKPFEMQFNAQNLLMVYLQHSMWGGENEKSKKVLPAPIVAVSGVGIVDLDKKLWDMGIIPNQQELQKGYKILEEKGGTLTVTTPGQKEPALKLEVDAKPNYDDMQKARKMLQEQGGTLTVTTPDSPNPEITISHKAGQKVDDGEWYQASKAFEEKGGMLTVATDKKETYQLEYRKLDPKDWERANALLGDKGGTLSIASYQNTVTVDFKKADEATLEKGMAQLAAGGALKVTHPGMKQDAFTIDALPADKETLEGIRKQVEMVRKGTSHGDLKNDKFYSQALMLALAADPTTNESARNVRAYRDFFRALEPGFEGDRVAMAKDAIARGVKPERVFNRIDGGLFSSYTDHETAMTMAVRTENADLVALLVKHGQTLTDDHIRQAFREGSLEFGGRILALAGKEKFEAGDKLGVQLLGIATYNKDEEMFRSLEKRGASLTGDPQGPGFVQALFESRFAKNRYDHQKHETFLKYLVEEKKVPVFDKDQEDGGALFTSAYYGKDAFQYMLDKTVKQSGKTPTELLGMPVERYRDGELLVHRIASFGKADALEVILKHRPDDLNVKTNDSSREPPLVKAFTFGNYEVAKKLLEMKADIHVSGEFKDLGDMALDPVGGRSKERLPMVKLLAENGYNIFQKGKERRSFGTLRQRAGEVGNKITDYLENKEKEIAANADKFAAATKEMKKPDILKKIQEKDSGFTPSVLKSILELEDYEQSTKKREPRFTDEQRQTMEEVLGATKKVSLSTQPGMSFVMPALDQFIGSGLKGGPIRSAADAGKILPA